jgi:branched-chain amino acid transport system permease protein
MVDLPSGTFNVSYVQDMMLVRTPMRKVLLILFLVFMYLIPVSFWSRYLLQVLISFIIWIIAAQGLNVLTGLCGQISLGHAAFVGVGAYTAGILSTKAGLPFWVCLPLAGLASALCGVLFGLPSVRVKGFYLALSTMGAHFILLYVFLNWTSLTGGAEGMQMAAISLGHFSLDNSRRFFPFVFTICIVMTFIFTSIRRSSMGRAFIAVKDNDIAAESLGINSFKYKTIAFGIGCFYAGIAGYLMSYNLRFVSVDYFPFLDSLWYVGIIIIGGMGSVVGPIFGVVFVKGISEVMTLYVAPLIARVFPALGLQISASISLIFFALIIIVFIVFEPRGLAYRWHLFKNYYRLWPFPY